MKRDTVVCLHNLGYRLLDVFNINTHIEWSEVKNKAWKQRKRNPNAFYYRFNEPGEENKVGPWSEEEKKLFFIRLEEMGGSASRNWGIFSKAIPGRVGYQCAAFYRYNFLFLFKY